MWRILIEFQQLKQCFFRHLVNKSVTPQSKKPQPKPHVPEFSEFSPGDFSAELCYLSRMAKKSEWEPIVEQIDVLTGQLAVIKEPSTHRRNKLQNEIQRLIAKLREIGLNLDPVKHPNGLYDPSSPFAIAITVARELLRQERVPMAEISSKPFYGSGVYAIYYRGHFPAYAPISKTDVPIYVGKADPGDKTADTAKEQGISISQRLNTHAKNIGTAGETLSIDDFECRFLVVKSGWQGPAEEFLIHLLKPVWNKEMKVCYGFGKHGDAAVTRKNTRSPWDTLHSGRKWATNKENKVNPLGESGVMEKIRKHYEKHPPTKIEEMIRTATREFKPI